MKSIRCVTCGSENVRLDAWAVWDKEEQDWVLGQVFDQGHCAACDGATSLVEVTEPTAQEKLKKLAEYVRTEWVNGRLKGTMDDELIAIIHGERNRERVHED